MVEEEEEREVGVGLCESVGALSPLLARSVIMSSSSCLHTHTHIETLDGVSVFFVFVIRTGFHVALAVAVYLVVRLAVVQTRPSTFYKYYKHRVVVQLLMASRVEPSKTIPHKYKYKYHSA